jgi:hypothetical protein
VVASLKVQVSLPSCDARQHPGAWAACCVSIQWHQEGCHLVRSGSEGRRSWGTVGVESRLKATSSNKQQRERLWEMCIVHPASGSRAPPAFGRESQCVLALGVMVVLLTIVKMEHPSRLSSCLLSDPRPPVCWNRARTCWLVQSMLQ